MSATPLPPTTVDEPVSVPPSTPAASSSSTEREGEGFNAFAHLLDTRILRALATLGFGTPTLVQQKCVPLALEGRDLLVRARTGSGKTLAYGLPLVQKVLDAKRARPRGPADPLYQATRALILVPTRELSEQVTAQISALLHYASDAVSVANVARDASAAANRLLLSERPDIVVATPSRALACLQSNALQLSETLESLVIDEADLILSYGHDADVRALLVGALLPKQYQSLLMSATMTSDVAKLKGLVLRNPVVLKLEHDPSSAAQLTQYYARVSEEDKFLLTYVILKLRLIRGKCILFVNHIDRSYRLKLFLEQFGLRCCVLNAELPINSRYHIVQEFNKGVYDYIIATDESNPADNDNDAEAEDANNKDKDDRDRDRDRDGNDGGQDEKKRKRGKDKQNTVGSESGSGSAQARARAGEYGVSRGIDFVAVACVINFDLPTSVRSYIHRVGRTARAGASGTSLSFVVPRSEYGVSKSVSCATCAGDEGVFRRISASQGDSQGEGKGEGQGGLREWRFDRKQVDAFRYRAEDAVRSITRAAIRDARIREIKAELLNSERLRAHFDDNPTDLDYLRHDKALRPARVQAHMKHVPAYLRPRILGIKQQQPPPSAAQHAKQRSEYLPKHKKQRRDSKKGAKKKSDPLRKFGK